MPNGKAGDHPYTDIVLHDMSVLTERIREIVYAASEGWERGADERLRSLLWEYYRPSDSELPELERRVETLHERVQRADEYGVESPLAACLCDDDTVYTAGVRQYVRDIHGEINREQESPDRTVTALSELLWSVGWETDSPDELADRLAAFRRSHLPKDDW